MKNHSGLITCSFKSLKTLYLFGKSDIPATFLPSIVVALVLAGPSNLHLIIRGILWNQLHLLTFQVKNQVSVEMRFMPSSDYAESTEQIDGLEEDKIAKPHRPIPSGLISLGNARVLYYVLFVSMWVAALCTNTVACTLIYSVAILMYNEGGLAANPIIKNILGALGLLCYCWGTAIIFNHGRNLDGLKPVALLLIGAVTATTGHAQDFRDRSADNVRGRKTIPLLFPQSETRWLLAALIIFWTIGLTTLWRPPTVATIAYTTLGLRSLGGFVLSHDEKDDYVSYRWYGFWLIGSGLLPIFPRIRGEL